MIVSCDLLNSNYGRPLIVFQINNFQAPLLDELANYSKILTHFLHNANNFTRILHIRFERLYD